MTHEVFLQSNNNASRYRWDVCVKLWVVFLKQQRFMYLQLTIVIIGDVMSFPLLLVQMGYGLLCGL